LANEAFSYHLLGKLEAHPMRMPDPNAPECDCSVLETLSKEPRVPIIYDPELNEYLIQATDGLNKVKMHHCFFCGGRLPKSRRADLFMHITEDERMRLWAMLKDIQFLPDLLAAFGPQSLSGNIRLGCKVFGASGGLRRDGGMRAPCD
jgi:hypothetical protein